MYSSEIRPVYWSPIEKDAPRELREEYVARGSVFSFTLIQLRLTPLSYFELFLISVYNKIPPKYVRGFFLKTHARSIRRNRRFPNVGLRAT